MLKDAARRSPISVSVTSRWRVSIARKSTSSRSRPTNDATCAGRLSFAARDAKRRGAAISDIGERDKSVARQHRAQIDELALAPDKRRDLRGQIVLRSA